MIGQDKLIPALCAGLKYSKHEVTIVAQATFSGLTRFANNYIHQNLHSDTVNVSVRVKVDKRVGVAATVGLDPDNLKKTVEKAEAIALSSPPNPDLPPLYGPRGYRLVPTFDSRTASYTPEDRAKAVKTVCDMAKENNAIASGLFSSGYSELAVVNSSGLRTYAPLTSARLMAIVGDGPSSGYGSALSRKVKDIDPEAVAKVAVEKCLAGKKRIEIEPGDYEVVLEHAAVADAMEWLSYIGFGSKTSEEGTSFIAGRKGEKLTQPDISIYDDGYNPNALGVPFDYEGIPKQAVHFIKDGICGHSVHDSLSASRAKTFSTGHALPPTDAAEGAMPMNIIMDGGDSSVDEMVANVKKGILVTRFHYINGFVNTREAVLTGMTRDGTFLVENGEVVGGLPNMRFMQSFLEAFNQVKAISKDQKTFPNWFGDTGAYYTPAIHVDGFRFIGVQKED